MLIRVAYRSGSYNTWEQIQILENYTDSNGSRSAILLTNLSLGVPRLPGQNDIGLVDGRRVKQVSYHGLHSKASLGKQNKS